MSYIRSYNPVLHFDDDHGHPLADGWLFTFLAGTSTPVATSANENGTAMNPVRIHLDSRGECEVWLDPSIKYKFEIWDSTRTWHKTVDNVFVTEGGSGGGGGNVRRSDLKPLTLKKGNHVFGVYNPLEQKTIDIPDSICYISEQAPNLYRAVADMLIADIMPVLMRSDTDPNVQGVTRDHYYYPAARTGVNSDYEFIGYDGDRVEVATVHQDNSVTYSVKPNGVHRLAKKYVEVDGEDVMTLGDGDRCSGAEPNGETVTKSELLAWLDAGETLIFSFYGFGNYQKRWGIAENVILDGSGSSRYVRADFYVRTVDEYLFEHYRIYTTADSEFVTLLQYQSISNENTENKVQTLDDSGSHYPSCPAVKSYVAGAMPAASTATPAMDGVASAGSSTSWARGDHVHPTDSSREAVANRTTTVRITGADDTHYPTEAAVRSAIDSAVSSAYHAAGTKTVSQLTSTLLDPLYLGCVYNITDSGMTTADFVDGAGHPIVAGDNVGICDVGGGVYKFDLLSGFVDLSTYVKKSSTAGLLKNDGGVDTNDYLPKTGDGKDVTATFMTASSRANISTGEKLSVIFGNVAKWFADLKALAFKDSVSDGDISGTIQDGHIASSASWSAKYDKPSTGIPASDMSSAVQTSLGKADTAIQDVSGKLDKTGDASNATSSLTKNSGDTSDMTSGGKLSAIFTAISNAFATFFSHVSNTNNPHSVTKSQVGLSSVVNTGDSATPVEGGTTKFTTGGAYTELAKKVDKESGKGLSSNDFTNAYKSDIDNNSAARHTHSAGKIRFRSSR